MIKILSLFSGIGAFEKALQNLNIKYELLAYSEIDKYASKAYSLIHKENEGMNLGDIVKIDTSKFNNRPDLITYGFPCQDISLAGKLKGFGEEGEQTRSGLFFEALRLIRDLKPKYAIAENVKNLTSKRFKNEFEIVLSSLEEAGYNNYWKVLNAKDYGIPQNRERVFIISIRKDIDDGNFEFPEPFPLKLRLKDMLENEVDEKYYLSNKMMDYLTNITEKNKARGNGNIYSPSNLEGVCKTITTKEGQRVTNNFIEEPEIKPIRLGGLFDGESKHQAGSIWEKNGIAPTIDTMQGGFRQPMIIEEPKIQVIGNYSPSGHDASRIVNVDGLAPTVKENHGTVTAIVEEKIIVREATKKGYAEAEVGDSINLERPNSKTRRGRVGKQVSQTLTTSMNQGVVIK